PMSVPGNQVAHTMGKVLPDAVGPTVSAGGPYAAPEGSALQFAAAGTGPGGAFDNCDTSGANLNYVWNFGDGTTATGKNPTHAFADNGVFAGTLTVKDGGNNTTVSTFSTTVRNAK